MTAASLVRPSGTGGEPVQLAGWGAHRRVVSHVVTPETVADVRRGLDHRGTVPRGLGRSYGDPAQNEGRRVIRMTRLDRYIAFDAATATLTCEAGVSLARIIEDFVPRGFFPVVSPGTKYVTVGGCIANDVHGKAHHVDGSFSNCVASMTVLLASGEVVTASREEHSDLFWGSFGGMGLLGVILTATLRLRRIETSYFRQTAIRVKTLGELVDAFEEHAERPYSVAWIDPLATGARLGRGVLTVGDHAGVGDLPPPLAEAPLRVSGPPRITVPFELPEITLNPLTLRLLNVAIERVQSRAAAIVHYEKFFYPLDAIGHWYRGYGRRGFTQYQFVIPLEHGPERMRALLEAIASAGQLPFLNVLKKFGPKSGGMLSFPFEGYTFAIDFPIRDGLPEMLARLDAMVLDAGGRIYLGKDAFVRPETFRAMYPELDTWLEIKAKYDPDELFTSDLGRRVGLNRATTRGRLAPRPQS